MKHTFVVLETRGYVETLLRTTKALQQSLGRSRRSTKKQVVVPILTRDEAIKIIWTLVDECLAQYVNYRKPNNQTAELAAILTRKDRVDSKDIALTEDFLCMEPVDNMIIDLMWQVGHHVSSNRWRQWDLHAIGDLIVLIGGQDYRIAEWERLTDYHTSVDENLHVQIDVATLANYIQQTLVRHLGEAGYGVPVKPFILDAVARQYPNTQLGESLVIPSDALARAGLGGYEAFWSEHLRDALQVFLSTCVHTRIDSALPYRVTITDTYLLEFRAMERPKTERDRLYWELRESLERGDWLPERDRRFMEEYERTG